MLPLLYLAPMQEAVSSFSFSLDIMAFLAKNVFTKFRVQLHEHRLFLLISHWALLMGRVCTAVSLA